jgi:signal transduction histidine kinase
MPASRLYAALGLCCLFVISLTSYVLWRSHFEEYNRAKTFTQNLVHATSLSLAAELRQIDLVLQTIADEASHEYQTGKLDPRFLTQTMNRQNGRLHAIGGFLITDKDGNHLFDNFLTTPKSGNVADRAYFAELRDHPEHGLVISDPIFGRFSNKWLVIFARRINGPDGTFAGEVQGFIDLTWFDTFFAESNLGPDGIITLRDANLGLILRYPERGDRVGQLGSKQVSQSFEHAYRLNPDAGTYEAALPIDGISRVISYKRLPEFPFYISVGYAKSALLARWYNDSVILVIIVAIFIAAMITLGVVTIRAWERQERAISDEAAAQAANEAKSTFLAHMSHELRTPLNVISNYSLLLHEELKDAGQTELVDIVGRIDSARGHLLALISNILDLSKIEADKIDIDIHEVKLGELVQEAESAALAVSTTNNNKFRVECAADLGSLVLTTDGTRVKQCLLNLISNAMKFTKDGVVKLSVSRQADQIIFAVSDNGIGMTDEQAARLFQPFIQADRTTTRRFGGTGLGLYLTKSFVTILGGSLKVDSAPGQGATFTMTLPVTTQMP